MNFEDVLERIHEAAFAHSGRYLSEPQVQVLRGTWNNLTYDEMAEAGYSAGYLRQDVGPKLWELLTEIFQERERVGKKNFRLAATRWMKRISAGDRPPLDDPEVNNGQSEDPVNIQPPSEFLYDWGSDFPFSTLHGRQTDADAVKAWIEQERCRVVMLTGVGGIGKTALAWAVATALKNSFHIIWRSLHDQSPQDVLQDIHSFLATLHPDSNLASSHFSSSSDLVSTILQLLQQQPCLIVLDRFESVFQPEETAGCYQPSCREYEDLLRQVVGRSHSGCLLLTSREISADWQRLPPAYGRVKALEPLGLTQGQHFFDAFDVNSDLFSNSSESAESDWLRLLDICDGNPSTLNEAATALRTLFASDVAVLVEEMERGYLPPSIRDSLAEQIERLSLDEREILDALAIAQQPLSLTMLRQGLVSLQSRAQLPDTLDSLLRRSLIQSQDSFYVLTPMLKSYVRRQFVQHVVDELVSGNLRRFLHHALIRANSRDDIRERQQRLVLQPIAKALQNELPIGLGMKGHLQHILSRLRSDYRTQAGYGAGNIVNLYRHMGWSLEGMDFSRLPLWQACLDDVSLAGVNLARAKLRNCKFSSCLGSQPVVALDRQGEFLVVGDRQGQLLVWTLQDNQQRIFLSEPESSVTCLAVHPHRPLVASGHTNQRIYLWDTNTAKRIPLLMPQGGAVTSLRFSADGATLASGSTTGWVQCWTMESLQVPQLSLTASVPIRDLEWGMSDRQLISLSDQNEVIVWDVETGDRLHTFQSSEMAPAKTVFFSNNNIPVSPLSPDESSAVVVCSEEGRLRLFDLVTKRPIQSLQSPADGLGVITVATVPNNQLLLAAANPDQVVRVWNLSTNETLQTFSNLDDPIVSLDIAANGSLLATASDQAIRLWDLETGTRYKTLARHQCRVCSLSISQDGAVLAVGNDDCTIKLLNLRTDSDLKTLRGHVNWVYAIAFSPDHKSCASGSDDGTIKLWDIDSGRSLQSFSGHRQTVRAIAFSPDGQKLASVSDDGSLKLWNLDTGTCINSVLAHNHRIFEVEFSPAGDRLATCSADQHIGLWDAATLESITLPLEGHQSRLRTLAFNTQGDYLLSGGDDQTARLWNLSTGECEQVWDEQASKIHAVAFDAHGQGLVCASHQGRFGIWSLAQERWIASIADEPGFTLVQFGCGAEVLIAVNEQDQVAVWSFGDRSFPFLFQVNQLYKNMNISGVTGINEAQKKVLRQLGAVEQ